MRVYGWGGPPENLGNKRREPRNQKNWACLIEEILFYIYPWSVIIKYVTNVIKNVYQTLSQQFILRLFTFAYQVCHNLFHAKLKRIFIMRSEPTALLFIVAPATFLHRNDFSFR